MGCCESENKIDQSELSELTLQKMNFTGKLVSDDFNDLSISSHANEFPLTEESNNHLCVSNVYYTRSTSVSLHHASLENAFLLPPKNFFN